MRNDFYDAITKIRNKKHH
ncbi:hypothetical protein [Borreliella garinii]